MTKAVRGPASCEALVTMLSCVLYRRSLEFGVKSRRSASTEAPGASAAPVAKSSTAKFGSEISAEKSSTGCHEARRVMGRQRGRGWKGRWQSQSDKVRGAAFGVPAETCW